MIPANGLTRKGNLFALTGNPLNDFASSLIGVLGSQNYLTPSTPTTQLTSSKIILTNPNPQGKPVDATASGPVIVSVVPSLQVPQLSPAVLQVTLDPTSGQATAVTTTDLTLDWLGNVASVHADVTVESAMDNKPTWIDNIVDTVGLLRLRWRDLHREREAHHRQQGVHDEAQCLASSGN